VHELSIALSLVDVAGEQGARHGGRVQVVHVRLGPLSGVVKDALVFSFDVATRGTPLEGSRLLIEDVPLVVYCPDCHAEREIASPQALVCDLCGRPTPDVRSGRELQLVALEVDA